MKTDAELISRAEHAGWIWCENEPSETMGGMRTGWKKASSFQHLAAADKANHLRKGFDHDLNCVECGLPIWTNWLKSTKEELISRVECFDCIFWLTLIRKGGGVVVGSADGPRQHYMLGNNKTPHRFNGSYGDWFTVQFIDGRTVETCDLWSQGLVPERFWLRLPVNATLHRGRMKVDGQP